jgi:hypothetical protein
MVRHIENRAKELEQDLTHEDLERLHALLSNKDAVKLCQIYRLGTMKNTLLWVLGKKQLNP